MMSIDKQTFFSALGFITAHLQGNNKEENFQRTAETISGRIKAFCLDKQEKAPARVVWLLDQIISSMKTQMKAEQPVELPESRDLKLELLHTLHDRQCLYVMDAQKDSAALDVSILNLLKAEQQHVKSEAQMMIAHVQGDPNAYAPYQYLATTIANIIRKKGKCSKKDIQELGGFTEGELQNWNMAYALAQVDLMEG